MEKQSTDYIKQSSASTPRISFYEYLYVFTLIIYTGHANTYVASTSILNNPVWVSLMIVLSGILALKWSVVFNKQFYILILGYLIYFLAISIKFKEIRPTFFLNNAFLFFIAYSTVKSLKVNFFRVFESTMFFLAVTGLIMWAVQIVLGGDTLYSYFGKVPSIDTFSNVSGDGFNLIFYSVQPTTMSIQFNFLPPRNCGFAWEPGGFAVMLSLAIMINLFFFRADRKSRIRFWILLFALISSQSTTGYMALVFILLFYYYNRKPKLVLILWPLLAVIIILIFSLPFMSDKIVSLINETSQIDYMVAGSIGREEAINPQRFASFMIAFRDFVNNPILGLGGVDAESWTARIGANVGKITGIGNLMAQYGIVGFLFFIIASYKSSSFFSRTFNYRGKFLFFIIIIFISISYTIILWPLMMSFWMFRLFTPLGLGDSVTDIANLSSAQRNEPQA
jgi:hypothetical protein